MDPDRARPVIPLTARGHRRLRSWAALCLAAVLATAVPSSAQFPPTGIERLNALALPQIVGLATVDYSPSAETAARHYAAEIDAAIAWYRAELGWEGSARVAVLEASDYPRVGTIPYPSPYTQTRIGLIVIADDVSAHPGFELWDLDPVALNTAWAYHELGHLISRELGIWSANVWVGELIANMFMAAYVRAERPEHAGFQSGMPPRFASDGLLTRLAEFDSLYFAMGQLNYLWFQFEIAAMADFMVADAEFSQIVAALRREFPIETAQAPLTIPETLERLERIKPGITALAAPLL